MYINLSMMWIEKHLDFTISTAGDWAALYWSYFRIQKVQTKLNMKGKSKYDERDVYLLEHLGPPETPLQNPL